MADWIRLDVGYFTNHKILRAGPDAALMHLAAICYLGGQGELVGLLPAEAVPVLAAQIKARRPAELVERLVKCSLWHPGDDGDYIVHDYRIKNGDQSEGFKARERQRRHREEP